MVSYKNSYPFIFDLLAVKGLRNIPGGTQAQGLHHRSDVPSVVQYDDGPDSSVCRM